MYGYLQNMQVKKYESFTCQYICTLIHTISCTLKSLKEIMFVIYNLSLVIVIYFFSLSQYSSLKKSDDYIFFTEEKLYWTPGEDTSVLYEQLAQKKYREILRQEIELV